MMDLRDFGLGQGRLSRLRGVAPYLTVNHGKPFLKSKAIWDRIGKLDFFTLPADTENLSIRDLLGRTDGPRVAVNKR